MPLPSNPYIAGNPVGTTNAFIGRDDVLREVLRVLRNPNQNAITLFGQRRIGKTSVLENLVERLPKEGNYHPVYFDLQDKAAWTVQKVLKILARTIAESLKIEPFEGDEADFKKNWLPNALAQLPEKTSLVLLFDEFDVLADPKATQAVEGLFPYLRELLQLDFERLQFVFVLGRNLSDLSQLALSLFKGVPDKRVSLLSEKDTFKLIQLSEKNNTLTWSNPALERIYALTNGHPFLTQALASQVWENVYENEPNDTPEVNPEMVDEAILATLKSSRNTLRWLWDGLGPAEKVVASALAQAGDRIVTDTDLERILRECGVRILIRELQNAPVLLQDWDILAEVNGGYRFRVELLRQWIVEHKPLNRVQEELDYIQPVAENMFQAAQGLYKSNNLSAAEGQLRQALNLNPSHLRANKLLAEILISQSRLEEAQETLETLLDLAPSIARSRLVQVYLQQAKEAADDEIRLPLWEKVIGLDPNEPEAIKGISAIKSLEKEEQELALRFMEGRQALEKSSFTKAQNSLEWVVCTRTDYQYEDDFAADLLAEAVRHKKETPPFWKKWLRDPQKLAFGAGVLVLLILTFLFGMGKNAFNIGVEQRIGAFGTFAPSYTPTLTPTATFTGTPTLTPTITNTPPPPQAGSLSIRKKDQAVIAYIPAGEFTMGSTSGGSDESPEHKITLDAFWLDQNEVTNAMYALCVEAGNCDLPNSTGNYEDTEYAQHPVVYVSWNDAKNYCEWAGGSLPTEAQWEKAARGGLEGENYPWGDDAPICTAGADNGTKFDDDDNCNDTGTEPVGSYGANGYALYDMAGNVWEWTADWYDNNYYANSPTGNPLGPETGTYRVLRGGSWYDDDSNLRVANRSFNFSPVNAYNRIGFRCLLSLP